MSLFKKLSFLAVLCGWVALASSTAYAIPGPLKSYKKMDYTLLAKVNTTTTRTFTIYNICSDTAGCYGLALLYFWHEDHASLTNVTMACVDQFNPYGYSASIKKDYIPQDCATIEDGLCTSADVGWTRDLTAAKLWGPWRVNIMGMAQLKCTLTFTGGSANDSIRVDGAMMTL